MKKNIIILGILAIAGVPAFAQDVQAAAAEAAKELAAAEQAQAEVAKPCYWTLSSDFDLGFNQNGLTNWAAGGYNTITLAAGVNAKANYAKDLMSWTNNLQLNYGFLYSEDKKGLIQKNVDRLFFDSKWGLDLSATSKWKYTASFDFRSQFTDGFDRYDLVEGTTDEYVGHTVSSFLAPAYTTLALGMEWNPTDWFNINIAPVTGGFTLCMDDRFRANYGMKLIDEKIAEPVGTDYKSALFQLGAQVKVNASFSINDVLNYQTQLVVFTDYLNKPFVYNRVNWDNKISWKLSKLFKVGLDTWLIYDPLVTIVDKNGVPRKSLTQFRELFAINLTYSITNKK